jgi:hypothetical protein
MPNDPTGLIDESGNAFQIPLSGSMKNNDDAAGIINRNCWRVTQANLPFNQTACLPYQLAVRLETP